METFSDYIVYVDESGDHGLRSINRDYPMFVLAFCVFRKDEYANVVVPSLTQLKFETFGHDMVVLHETEIRKRRGPFRMMNKGPREAFMDRLGQVIESAPLTVIAVAIRKQALVSQYVRPTNPYHLAMEFGLERLHRFLDGKGQLERQTHVVCEARGKREDQLLELEFRRVCNGDNYFGKNLPFQVVFADKRSNSTGLQLADMIARPIGLSILRPDQPNRAADILQRKFYRSGRGVILGFGLKVFP